MSKGLRCWSSKSSANGHALVTKILLSSSVFVADYVLGSYGTGAIMAVPAHDQRDFDFAKAYSLDITPVVQVPEDFDIEHMAYTGSGAIVNSNNSELQAS